MCLGDNRHYTVDKILPRHFQQTADSSGLPAGELTELLAHMSDNLPHALDQTIDAMPDGFPEQLAHSIRDGAIARRSKIKAHLETQI